VYQGPEGMTSIPKFSSLRLLGSGWVKKLDLRSEEDFKKSVAQTPAKNFVYSLSGILKIRKHGLYKICAKSGDGSRLQIHHHKLIDNDGVHAPTKKCIEKHLTHGKHPIRITGFLASTTPFVAVTYKGKDTDGKKKHMRVFRNRNHKVYYWGSDNQYGRWTWLIRHRSWRWIRDYKGYRWIRSSGSKHWLRLHAGAGWQKRHGNFLKPRSAESRAYNGMYFVVALCVRVYIYTYIWAYCGKYFRKPRESHLRLHGACALISLYVFRCM
jgi:hypothetical protein